MADKALEKACRDLAAVLGSSSSSGVARRAELSKLVEHLSQTDGEARALAWQHCCSIVPLVCSVAESRADDAPTRCEAWKALEALSRPRAALGAVALERLRCCALVAVREAAAAANDLRDGRPAYALRAAFGSAIHVLGSRIDAFSFAPEDRRALLEDLCLLWRATADGRGSGSVRKECVLALLRMRRCERHRAFAESPAAVGLWLECVAKELREEPMKQVRGLLSNPRPGVVTRLEDARILERFALEGLPPGTPRSFKAAEMCCLACGPFFFDLLSATPHGPARTLLDAAARDAEQWPAAIGLWSQACGLSVAAAVPSLPMLSLMTDGFCRALPGDGPVEAVAVILTVLAARDGFWERLLERPLTPLVLETVEPLLSLLLRSSQGEERLELAVDVWAVLVTRLLQEADERGAPMVSRVLLDSHGPTLFNYCFRGLLAASTLRSGRLDDKARMLADQVRIFSHGLLEALRAALCDPATSNERRFALLHCWIDCRAEPSAKAKVTETGIERLRVILRRSEVPFDRPTLYAHSLSMVVVPTVRLLLACEPWLRDLKPLDVQLLRSLGPGGQLTMHLPLAVALTVLQCRRGCSLAKQGALVDARKLPQPVAPADDREQYILADFHSLLLDIEATQRPQLAQQLATVGRAILSDPHLAGSVVLGAFRLHAWAAVADASRQRVARAPEQSLRDAVAHEDLLCSLLLSAFMSFGATASTTERWPLQRDEPEQAAASVTHWVDSLRGAMVPWRQLASEAAVDAGSLSVTLCAVVEEARSSLLLQEQRDIGVRAEFGALAEATCAALCCDVGPELARLARVQWQSVSLSKVPSDVTLQDPLVHALTPNHALARTCSLLSGVAQLWQLECCRDGVRARLREQGCVTELTKAASSCCTEVKSAVDCLVVLGALERLLELMVEESADLLHQVLGMIRRCFPDGPTQALLATSRAWVRRCMDNALPRINDPIVTFWNEFVPLAYGWGENGERAVAEAAAAEPLTWDKDWIELICRRCDGSPSFFVPPNVHVPSLRSSAPPTNNRYGDGGAAGEEEEEEEREVSPPRKRSCTPSMSALSEDEVGGAGAAAAAARTFEGPPEQRLPSQDVAASAAVAPTQLLDLSARAEGPNGAVAEASPAKRARAEVAQPWDDGLLELDDEQRRNGGGAAAAAPSVVPFVTQFVEFPCEQQVRLVRELLSKMAHEDVVAVIGSLLQRRR